MYADHPCFESPADPNVRIWRYLDFTKYVSLLDRRSLYFARARQLEDRFEGSFSSPTLGIIEKAVAALPPDVQKASRAEYTKNAQLGLEQFAVNSWHMNDYESAAMWKLYLKSNEGVAIQSSYSRLVESVAASPIEVMIGKINYIDYRTDSFALGNAFWPFLYKRKSFEHERELRALVWEPRYENWRGARRDISTGVPVEVHVETLIENVFVSPTAGAWFRDLVRSVSQRYGLDRTGLRSDLDSDPLF